MLDYDIQISPLEEADKMFVGGPLGNYRSVFCISLPLSYWACSLIPPSPRSPSFPYPILPSLSTTTSNYHNQQIFLPLSYIYNTSFLSSLIYIQTDNCHNPTNKPKQLKTTFVGVVFLSVNKNRTAPHHTTTTTMWLHLKLFKATKEADFQYATLFWPN